MSWKHTLKKKKTRIVLCFLKSDYSVYFPFLFIYNFSFLYTFLFSNSMWIILPAAFCQSRVFVLERFYFPEFIEPRTLQCSVALHQPANWRLQNPYPLIPVLHTVLRWHTSFSILPEAAL